MGKCCGPSVVGFHWYVPGSQYCNTQFNISDTVNQSLNSAGTSALCPLLHTYSSQTVSLVYTGLILNRKTDVRFTVPTTIPLSDMAIVCEKTIIWGAGEMRWISSYLRRHLYMGGVGGGELFNNLSLSSLIFFTLRNEKSLHLKVLDKLNRFSLYN